MYKQNPFINCRAVMVLFLLIWAVQYAGAWGRVGHQVVGAVAENHLNRKAKKKINEILGGEALATASTWMDEVRGNPKYRYMSDWHWVTIPDGKTYAQAEKNPHGDIVMAIDRALKELGSHQLSREKEMENLKILIHLVGDIHQPLHVGNGTDKGGNGTRVKWFGKASNLHRVWDSEMIENTQLSDTELVLSLDRVSKNKAKKLQNTSIFDWARESMELRKQVYAIGDGNLGYEYASQNIKTVRKRLLEAGVRLAGLLNEIYG